MNTVRIVADVESGNATIYFRISESYIGEFTCKISELQIAIANFENQINS